MQTNVYGSLKMLNLAKQCKYLKCLLHVSTTYVNSFLPNNSYIDDKIYDLDRDFDSYLDIINNLTKKDMEGFKPKICDNFPNTYTLTK